MFFKNRKPRFPICFLNLHSSFLPARNFSSVLNELGGVYVHVHPTLYIDKLDYCRG